MLFRSHQCLCYFAWLCGYRLVHNAARDELFAEFLMAYFDSEAMPTLRPVPGIDLPVYSRELVARFANPGVRDTVARHVAVSRAFEQRFGHIPVSQLLTIIRANAHNARGGPLGTFAYGLRDVDGRQHEFVFDVFGNGGLGILVLGYTKT